jgi:hypothetical protein
MTKKLDLEKVEKALQQFGEVTKIEEENYYVNIRIEGFISKMENVNKCFSTVEKEMGDHYKTVVMGKAWNNHFHIMMKP